MCGRTHAQQRVRVVLLTYRVTNLDNAEASDVTAHCILPASNRYQDVIELQTDPAPVEARTDAEGQQVISVPVGPIPPGQTRAVRAIAWVRLKELRVPTTAARPDFEPLAPAARDGYLRDEPLLHLDRIRPTAEKAAARKHRDLDQARALYEYMAEHCRYDIDLEMDVAHEILDGTPASCSELAYTYVGMCRSIGIPARVVSAFVNRLDDAPSTDWRAHRWAEVFADRIGWVPVDPTNRINQPSDDFFGRQDGKYLTVIDDGSTLLGGSAPGWYALTVSSQPPRHLDTRRSAVWRLSKARPLEAKSFQAACEVLRSADVEVRGKAIEQWERDDEPLRVGFLLELLFDADPTLRAAAAAALGRSDDASVTLALMKRHRAEPDERVKKALIDAARQLRRTPDAERRAIVVGELAKSRMAEALPLLNDVAADPDRDVRKMAAQLVYKFGDQPAVHNLYRQLVDDEDDFVRVLATLRWARVGSHQALERLVDLLESDVRWDRERALAEIEKRTGDTFGHDPRARPNTSRNTEAIQKFRDWLRDHPDAK